MLQVKITKLKETAFNNDLKFHANADSHLPILLVMKSEVSKKQTSTFIYDYSQDKSQLLQFKHHSMGFTNSSSCHSARETIALYCSKVKSDSLSSEHSYSHGSS